MQFTQFSDPENFMIFKETATVDNGATNTRNKTSQYGDPNDDAVSSDSIDRSGRSKNLFDEYTPNSAIKESSAVIINQYKSEKSPLIEGSTHYWKDETKWAVKNFMDCTDLHTLEVISIMNEDQQNSLLTSLTNKLYGMIVNKIDDIDYGEIPNTRGDITRLHKYNDMRECLRILKEIFEQYKEKPEPVMEIERAMDNIENMKDIFVGAFVARAEFPMSVYKIMTLSVINSISFMIAVCIEYIKSPKQEGLEIVLNKTGIAKVKENVVYESLKDFNESCRKGEVENALKLMVQNKAKGFAMTMALGIKTVLVLGGVLIAILPMIRNLVYFFYAARTRVSTYFDLQAKLLDSHAEELKNNPNATTLDDKNAVVRRQKKIAETFRQIADAIAIDQKETEVKSTREQTADSRKYKIDDLDDTGDGNGYSSPDNGGGLF